MVWCFGRTSRTGPGSDCRATRVNERLTREKPRDVASGASSASPSLLHRVQRAVGSRADAREGGYPSLFRQKHTPRNGHGLCEMRVVLEFFGFFFWSMDARGGNDLLNS